MKVAVRTTFIPILTDQMIKKILLTILSAVLFWSLSSFAFAEAIQLDPNLKPDHIPSWDASSGSTENPEIAATQTLILYVGNLISQFLLFAGAITMIFLILAGANYIFAFGKDEKIENSKRALFWTLFGLVIVMLSYAIVKGVVQILLQIDASAN